MWRRLWRPDDAAGDGPPGAMSAAAAARESRHSDAGAVTPIERVTDAYWVILWRAPTESDRSESVRALQAGHTVDQFERRFLASPEFRELLSVVRRGEHPSRPLDVVERALLSIGDDAAFVRRAYSTLFERDADAEGLAAYSAALARGTPRHEVLETLLRSDEFDRRYRALCPDSGFIPRDVQLCELANPAKWDNPDWLDLLASLGLGPDKSSMHRKPYEFTQLLFGLRRLEALGDDVQVLSVGAGHEPVLYWLANHVGRVIATDMYGGAWQSELAMEGDEGVFVDPAQYAPFPYRQGRLMFLRMDGRHLAFANGTFDIVYSLSSVEHFGGAGGAKEAIGEMARVLKPGGLLVLSTEYCLSGPPHHEAFQPEEVCALLQHPSLALVEPVDERVWQRYQHVPINLRVNPYQTPHMVVTDLGSVFTTVMAFLRKRS